MRLQQLATALTLAVLSVACAPNAKLAKLDPKSAEYKYEAALIALEDGMYPEAVKGLSEVKSKHPYTAFARLADLRISDVYFEQGKYDESIGSYRRFLKYNPGHPEVPYAMFRIGEAYYERLPQDWWFLPPAAEKDQERVHQAIKSFRNLISRFPENDIAKEASKRVATCRTRLAQHEIYVADFYFKRDRFKASAKRAEAILQNYPGLGLDARALWITGQSRFEIGEFELAGLALDRLIKEFPSFEEAESASTTLQKIASQKSAQTEPEAP
jgi:outer membrane protein assembly factor BamD